MSGDGEDYMAYPQRWYILGVFSLFACLQSCIWSLYGPIDLAVKYAYGWTDSTITMMANWGTIAFLIGIGPLTWFLEHQGLKATTLFCVVSSTSSLIIRMLISDPIYVVHVASFMNGLSGATVMSAPPVISAAWFPVRERTTATAVNQVFNQLGNSLSLTLGPRLVPDGSETNSTLRPTPEDIRRSIEWYETYLAIIGACLMMAVALYYPARPPTPPSSSSSIPRTKLWEGFKRIGRNKNFWLCCFAYSLVSGIQGAWSGIQTLDYTHLGIGDTEADNIGLVANLCSCAVGIAFGIFSDRFRRTFKASLTVLLMGACLCFVWLTLIFEKVVPSSLIQVYFAVTLGTCFSFATVPIFFEYAVELSYPVPENVVGAFLTTCYNVVSMIFLFVFFIPDVGFLWMNYLLAGSTAVAVVVVLFTTETYNRSDIDDERYRVFDQSQDDYDDVNCVALPANIEV